MTIGYRQAADDASDEPFSSVAGWVGLLQEISVCRRKLADALAGHSGRPGVGRTELLLLLACADATREGTGQNELAAAVGFSAGRVSGLVERLRRRGLLASQRDTRDRRRQQWQITPEGRTALGKALRQLLPVAAGFDRRFDRDAQRLLSDLLRRLAQAADAGREERETSAPTPLRIHSGLSLLGLVLAAVLTIGGGCSPGFYRRRADAEAYRLINEASQATRDGLVDFSIDVDPRSRMFDPFCPDHPPMPPDDPAAHRLMHRVDGKRGWPHWSDNGCASEVENAAWVADAPVHEGRLVLDADDAVRLALLDSREYQRELEDLYLSALDVSFERFRFDTQFFGGYETEYTADGRARAGSGGRSRSVLDLATFPASRGIRAEKMFATGTDLVVGLANSLVWQFSGPDDFTGRTLLDFALVQPLLRGGGRDRVLERLTIAERALLYNVRQMERFRRGFYLEIVTGRDAGPGPSRRGGFFGGSGLEGFSGVGGGGFGRIGSVGGGGGGAGAGRAGGFIGLVQDQQSIRNQESNVAALRSSLAQLEAFFQAGRIDFFQVELARQALFNAQSRLMTARAAYQTRLDGYKMTLGLPPRAPVEIRSSMLDRFNLLDAAIVPVQNRLANVQQQTGKLINRFLPARPAAAAGADAEAKAAAGQAAGQWRANLRRLKAQLAAAEQIRAAVRQENVPRARVDVQRLRDSFDRRLKDLQQLRRHLEEALEKSAGPGGADRTPSGEAFDPGMIDIDQLRQLPDELEQSLATLDAQFDKPKEVFARFDRRIDDILARGVAPDRNELLPFADELNKLSADVLELSLVQARARTESVVLAPVAMTPADALEIARENRRDWMNARGALVDSWRLIQFNADDLQSSLDVVFSGDISNTGDNPIRLRDSTGRLRVGLQFDAPLTRLGERNTYRQALIEYQQARRGYYAFQDAVSRSLRETLRTMDLDRVNFELRRAAVHVAVAQVELARFRLREPLKPEAEKAGAVFGATTARDLVQALSALLSAQEDFISVWVDYETLRRSLDFDIGTMQLDPEGIWIDPGPLGKSGESASSPPPGLTESGLVRQAVWWEPRPPLSHRLRR